MAGSEMSVTRCFRIAARLVKSSVIAWVLSVTLGVGVVTAEELVNALDDGVTMDGFDVVAYFKQAAPAKGNASHQVQYKGKTWLFDSEENAAEFSARPTKFEPQFNGWCSYAVSEGYGAEVDFVKGWVILDDKLYLNWNEKTKDEFVAEQASRKKRAAENWPAVHSGLQDGSVELYLHKDEPAEGISHPQQID